MPSISIVFLTAKNNFIAKEEQISFKDCAEAFKSGLTTSGIYTLMGSNTAQEKKVRITVKSYLGILHVKGYLSWQMRYFKG